MKLYRLVLFIVALWQFTECKGALTCNQQTVGTVFCVGPGGYYWDHQWATCLTNEYIQLKSKGKHICRDRWATYCYYQCMIEIHGKPDGAVYSDCRCDPNGKKPELTTPSPLQGWCNSPNGSNCNWYRQCLKKRYPCEEKGDEDYAIKYAEKFCELYNERDQKFSAKAQQWIDAVRKCLEIALVPLLRPWQKVSCKTLKDTAFKSHTPCYLNPGNSVSYCDLSFKDQMQVFWTIKSSFISPATFLPSLKGVWDASTHCHKQAPRGNINEAKQTFKKLIMTIRILSDKLERKRSVEETGYFAGRVIDAVASKQQWRKKGVAWFAFASNVSFPSQDRLISITVLLADRDFYEGRSPNSTVDVNITALEMAEAVKKGSFNTLQTGSGPSTATVAVVRMKGCADQWSCKETSFEVSAPSKSHSAGYKITSFGAIITALLVSTIVFLEMQVIGIDL